MTHRPWDLLSPAPGPGPLIATSVTRDEAAALGRLAAGRNVLEVGSAYGFSAIVMALAGARVTAVDWHADIAGSREAMEAAISAYEVGDRVEILAGPSQHFLPCLAGGGHLFDLVFIDSDHSGDAIRHDIQWGLKLLAPGGVLAVHDYGEDCHCPAVKLVADELLGRGHSVAGTLLTVTP